MLIKNTLILLLTTLTFSVCGQPLKFAMLENSETQNIAMCVLAEAYKAIGKEVQFHAFPATRSLKLSNEGHYDGEVSRILAANNLYRNLTPIITPTLELKATAFTLEHKDFKPQGFKSLAPFRVIIPKAVILFEKGTKDLPHVVKATDIHSPFKMLMLGRGDIVATSFLNGVTVMRSLGINNAVALSPPIMSIPLHHFLHKKHANLVPLISSQMAKMQDNGRIQQIYQHYVSQLTNPSIEPDFNNGDPPSVPCST